MNTTRRIAAYSADRYVIVCESPNGKAKVFQVAFAKSDASLFVTFPYLRNVPGRVGRVVLSGGMSFPTDVIVGEDFPVTSHSVKYSHHPSGRAHFSLSGKVLASMGKEAVSLSGAGGHLFTVMTQGLHWFDAMQPSDIGSSKRGVVPFGFKEKLPIATKFTAYLYSQSECGRRFASGNGSPWVIAVPPNGQSRRGILLATPYEHSGQRFFLLLTVEEIPLICEGQDTWLSLIGGFDPQYHGFDHARPTSFLMCIYPASDKFEVLAKQFGTIDVAA